MVLVITSHSSNDTPVQSGSSTASTVAKHGVEIRWAKGARLIILSYAVWVHGVCQVSHNTTRHFKGVDKNKSVERECLLQKLPII